MFLDYDKMARKAGEELQQLLEIGSSTGDETEVLAYLETKFRDMGLTIDYQRVIGVRYNLMVNPRENPDLIITVHTDTVPETINGNTCRYEITGNRFYGRGAADVKGGTAALIAAMSEVFDPEDKKPAEIPPVTFVFTVDEEREGRGSEEMATLNGHSAVVLEPTDLKICTAQSGSVMLEATVYGESAHGGEFESGTNAILKAFELLQKINGLPVINEQHPLVGSCGYNLQMIRGGSNEMVVPNQCEMHLDFRVLPNQQPEDVQSEVDELLDEYPGVESKWTEVSGSFEIDQEEPVVSLVSECFKEALEEEPLLGGIRSWTDAENLFTAGTRPIVFGPGSLAVSHTEEEYIDLPEVIKAARVLERLIRNAGQLKK